jgi:hypothetical protein
MQWPLRENTIPSRANEAFKRQCRELLELERINEGHPPFKELAGGKISKDNVISLYRSFTPLLDSIKNKSTQSFVEIMKGRVFEMRLTSPKMFESIEGGLTAIDANDLSALLGILI